MDESDIQVDKVVIMIQRDLFQIYTTRPNYNVCLYDATNVLQRDRNFLTCKFNFKLWVFAFYLWDIEILGWCPVGSVLLHGEKVPL